MCCLTAEHFIIFAFIQDKEAASADREVVVVVVVQEAVQEAVQEVASVVFVL